MASDNKQKIGMLLTVTVLPGVLLIFVLVLLTGSPVAALGGTENSLIYTLIVYIPILFICLLALRKQRSASPA